MRWVYKHNGSFHFIKSDRKPNNDAQLIDSSLWNENEDYLVASESIITDDKGVDRLVYNVTLDQGTKDTQEAINAAQRLALDAFMTLNKEVSLDAKVTSGTSNQISALMDLFTYNRMKEAPALFDQEGLVAKKDIGTFTKGDALDTALKITQYSEAMLAETDAFMIRRLKKITTYLLS